MYSGLKVHIPIGSEIWWFNPELLVIPKRRIVPDLYCSYEHFLQLNKPEPYSVFFVKRDPRDVLISWFFSNRYSHRPMVTVNDRRQALVGLSEHDGILATINEFDEIAGMLRSWQAYADAPGVRIVRYEDLTGADSLRVWSEILTGCDIPVPENVLRRVLDTYSFARISGGRTRGEEDKRHKYRKGVPGDWKNHFDEEITKRFYDRFGDLPRDLGYA